MTGLSRNVDQDSAIFLSALQKKPTKLLQMQESRAQHLICRIWDLVWICANAKIGSMGIVPFEGDRLKELNISSLVVLQAQSWLVKTN